MSSTTRTLAIVGVVALIAGALLLTKYTSRSRRLSPYRHASGTPSPRPTPEIRGMMHGQSTPTPTPVSSSSATPVSASTPAPTSIISLTLKTLTVTGQSFSLSPSTMTVKKGERVKITFKNAGGFHDLVIDGFGVKTNRINGGTEDSVEFTADKTGSFAYYCSVDNHRSMGMEGTLVVE